MADIFISYSRADEQFARHLAASLEAQGADVWLDQSNIRAGVKWSSAIQRGLRESSMMIVIITPDSMESPNVEDEWQYFLDRKKPLIPVLLKPADIHFQLSRIQYIDFAHQDYDTAFAQLIRELNVQGLALSPPTQPNTPGVLPQSNAIPPPVHRRLASRSLAFQVGIAAVIVAITLLLRQVYETYQAETASPTPQTVPTTQSAASPTASSPPTATSIYGGVQASQTALWATNKAIIDSIGRGDTPTPTPTSAPERVMNAAFAITAAFEGVASTTYTRADWGMVTANPGAPLPILTPLGQAFIFDMMMHFGNEFFLSQLAAMTASVSTLEDEQYVIGLLVQTNADSLSEQAQRTGRSDLNARGEFWLALVESGNWNLEPDANGNLVINGQTIYIGG